MYLLNQSPQVNRVFLGLQQPPLVSAAQRLVESYRAKDEFGRERLNLSNCLIVLPSRRAMNRLMQLLATIAQGNGLAFSPPIMTTIGGFPEYLYTPAKSLATDLAQQIAWSKALEQTPLEEIQCLTGREEVEDLKDWQPLAKLLSRLHTRLASDIWSFRSVAREVKSVPNFLEPELKRWEALLEIQNRYYKTLGEADLWDRQAARNYIAAGAREDVDEIRCESDKDIVLVAAADINRSIAGMLAQLESQITVMIAADEKHADRFNTFGNLVTEKWLDCEIEIPDENILIVDGPSDQAAAATHFITHLPNEFSTDEVTIGIPDDAIVPQLQRSLSAYGIEHRSLAGKSLRETPPVQLMIACREYLSEEDFESFADLVRHPDLFQWLVVQVEDDEWLAWLDEIQNAKLPNLINIDSKFPFRDPKKIAKQFEKGDSSSEKRAAVNAQKAKTLNLIHERIAALLLPLTKESQPIANWAAPWSNLLIEIYGDRELDQDVLEDSQTLKSCQAIHTALGNQIQVPAAFGTMCGAVQALDWALEAASDNRIVDPPKLEAVEFAGWLDLLLDDAPVMVVTGFNDQNVPSSEIGHQFLPNKLCETLGILDNNRRFARDAYALTVLSSVREHYLLLVGRHDAKKLPLKPSRLLFTEDKSISARRANAFFSYEGKPDSSFWLHEKSLAKPTQQFRVPRPVCENPPDELTVTRFKEYLKCPYRFYLNCILKMRTASDDWREMSGGTFGDLAHDVLESFANSDAVDSTSQQKIFKFLTTQLDDSVKKLFPGSRLPAMKIQIEQLRLRLEKFSYAQAVHRASGWKIVSTEELLIHELDVDGIKFKIRGKIDRVDQHEETGQVAVWDYKTSDKGAKPQQAHFVSKKWVDLQLPLYRHLVKEVSVVADADLSNAKMGYILLPKKLDDVGFHEAGWSPAMLHTADEAAFNAIRKIRDGVFWPPTEKPPMFSEDLAGILQDNVFERDDSIYEPVVPQFASPSDDPWGAP